MKRIVSALIVCSILSSVALLFSQEKDENEYHIAVHNILEISVCDEKELDTTARVAPNGTITFPLIGNVNAAGLTARELEAKLTELLEKDYLVNPQVIVFIKEYSKAYVLGQVQKPGAYELRTGLTVVGAIALAGGLTDIAQGNGTTVLRMFGNKKETISVPVDSILKGGDKSKDIVVNPDDIITVPESAF